eukprot:a342767_21.p1 GENE.a342767_21~~a342767_21.p1  ORF type:complete len:591 (+),score=208.18 a342767_21:31-1773(+)
MLKIVLCALLVCVLVQGVSAKRTPLSPLSFAQPSRLLGSGLAKATAELRAQGIESMIASFERAAVGARALTPDPLCVASSCSACIALPGCVWTPATETTPKSSSSSFDLKPVEMLPGCWPGTDSTGPTPRPGVTFGTGKAPMDLFSNSKNGTAIFWSKNGAANDCAKPAEIVAIEDPEIEMDENNYVDVNLRRQIILYPSTYGIRLTQADIDRLKAGVAALPEGDFSRFSYLLVWLLSEYYEGSLAVISFFGVGDGNANIPRADMGAGTIGFDISGYFRTYADLLVTLVGSGVPMDSEQFETELTARLRPLIKTATLFRVVFDRVVTLDGSTYDATTTPATSIAVTGLTADTLPSVMMGDVSVFRMAVAGALSDGSNFALNCYQGVDDWQYMGRTIAASSLECDVNITKLAPAAGKRVGLSAIVLAIDVLALAGSNANSLAFGTGGSFEVMPTATTTSPGGAVSTTTPVLTTRDPRCTGNEFVTPTVINAIESQSKASISFQCLYFVFDSPDATSVFWDPTAAVDEKAATAAVVQAVGASPAPAKKPIYKQPLYIGIAAAAVVVLVGAIVAVIVVVKRKK